MAFQLVFFAFLSEYLHLKVQRGFAGKCSISTKACFALVFFLVVLHAELSYFGRDFIGRV